MLRKSFLAIQYSTWVKTSHFPPQLTELMKSEKAQI